MMRALFYPSSCEINLAVPANSQRRFYHRLNSHNLFYLLHFRSHVLKNPVEETLTVEIFQSWLLKPLFNVKYKEIKASKYTLR